MTDIRHGTTTGYTRHKCRCQACRTASVQAVKAWRAANPERARELQRRQRNLARLRQQALNALADKYGVEYLHLLDQARGETVEA